MSTKVSLKNRGVVVARAKPAVSPAVPNSSAATPASATKRVPVKKVPPTKVGRGVSTVVPSLLKPMLTLPSSNAPGPQVAQTPANPQLLLCSPPNTRTAPAFELSYRRPIILVEAGDFITSPSALYASLPPVILMSGVNYSLAGIFFALDSRFSQIWNLTDVTIGDLGTTIALAPQEQLTVEVLTSQRKVLDQSTMDSTDSVTSTESTTSDKEAINVARSSSKTEGWHIDGSATVGVGTASVKVDAGYSKSITDSNQQTINHVAEATSKSAKNLKTMHSVSVRGVTETFVQSRMTRVLKNPYVDRTMTVNVFQLLKHFSVETDLEDQRAAFVVRIDSMQFNADFVQSHVSFLQDTLLDSSMVDALSSAVQGAKPVVQSGALDTAVTMSQLALRYLFDLDNVSKPSPRNILNLQVDVNDPNRANQNDPVESFMTHTASSSGSEGGLSVGDIVLGVLSGGASLTAEAAISAYSDFLKSEQAMRWSSGFDTAVRTKASGLFMTLAFFNAIVRETVTADSSNPAAPLVRILEKGDNAILIATALCADLSAQWALLYPDPLKSDELHAMMSSRNYTEVFRRVPGFLAMTTQLVRPLVEPAGADWAAITAHTQDIFNLNRLITHLNDYSDFYTSRFLDYIAKITNGKSVSQFARGVLQQVVFSFNFDPTQFDPDRAFISMRDVIIPGCGTLAGQDLMNIGRLLTGVAPGVIAAPVPWVEDIEVPCEGVHMETVAGNCVMANVPPQQALAATLNGLTLSLKP